MAEANANPPAQGGLTQEQVQAIVADTLKTTLPAAISGAVAEAVKPLGEQLKALQPTQQQQQPTALTEDRLTQILDERDNKRQQTDQQRQARETFIASDKSGLAKLANDPLVRTVIDAKLGNDPAKWESNAKEITTQFESLVKSSGGKLETVGGAAREGGQAVSQQPVDTSKLPAFERIHKGLPPVPSAQAPAEATAGAGAAK